MPTRKRPFRAGDWVKFAKLPPWVDRLPPESQAVFKFCLGRTFCIDEIESNGLLVLDVRSQVDQRFGGFMNDIRLEATWVIRSRRPNPLHLPR
jgi:hypothetical protein